MNRLSRLLLVSFLVVFIIVPQAKADHMTYDFWARVNSIPWNSSLHSDFFLKYVDYDDDSKFSLDELVSGSFSGITEFGWYRYTELVEAPQYNELHSPLTDGTNVTYWVFGYDGGPPGSNMYHVGTDEFTCIQGPEGTIPWPPPTPPSVPLPSAVILLGAGLGRFGLYYRRKRTADN